MELAAVRIALRGGEFDVDSPRSPEAQTEVAVTGYGETVLDGRVRFGSGSS